MTREKRQMRSIVWGRKGEARDTFYGSLTPELQPQMTWRYYVQLTEDISDVRDFWFNEEQMKRPRCARTEGGSSDHSTDSESDADSELDYGVLH